MTGRASHHRVRRPLANGIVVRNRYCFCCSNAPRRAPGSTRFVVMSQIQPPARPSAIVLASSTITTAYERLFEWHPFHLIARANRESRVHALSLSLSHYIIIIIVYIYKIDWQNSSTSLDWSVESLYNHKSDPMGPTYALCLCVTLCVTSGSLIDGWEWRLRVHDFKLHGFRSNYWSLDMLTKTQDLEKVAWSD